MFRSSRHAYRGLPFPALCRYPQTMDQTLAATLTAWRRHLHAHPELTLHEQETAAFVLRAS